MLFARACAKINLTLDVLGLLPGGYHRIASVMQSVSLCDYLLFEPAPEGLELICDHPQLPCGPQNLVVRAAELLAHRLRCRGGARVYLFKRIPLAAGLGGGSADAAAALLALNRLWGLGLGRQELLELAGELGADVPFFLAGGTVLAEGKGEILTPLPPLPPLGVVLVTPPVAVSTAGVYREFDRLQPGLPPFTPALVEALMRGEEKEVPSLLGNALEPVTASTCREIPLIKKKLEEAGALGAAMSGSGPTVFGLFPGIKEARRAAQRLPAGLGQVAVASFCRRAVTWRRLGSRP